MTWLLKITLCAIFQGSALAYTESVSVLYPRPSETRDVVSLDGIWDFTTSPLGYALKGFHEKWFSRGLRDVSPNTIPMPVPASYNDITTEKELRDYIGVVWYQRKFFVPASWFAGRRVWLRFGSVCYAAQVWVNGQLVTSHEIGHLPFQQEVTSYVNYGVENTLTVAVDNTLLQTTVPQGSLGEIIIGDQKILTQAYTFDFFNYAGIDRSVYLHSTPEVFISDVSVVTSVSSDNQNAQVSYLVEYSGNGNGSTADCSVVLRDKEGGAFTSSGCTGVVAVPSPKLWWPYLMDPNPGYLYTLEVTLTAGQGKDVYRQAVGIRSVQWTNTSVLLNNKPIYIRGFGRHEDSDIRGKGLDLSLIVKDYNLIKWVGANAYRTSHYPYAEEIMDMADQQGIMIINECPSVDTDIFTTTLKDKHKNSLTELIRRDKNRPSVIMWSVANEPRTQQPAAEQYFGDIVSHVKSLDKTRPVTIALSRTYGEDKAAQFLDVVSFNRYNSWYSNTGRTETIAEYVVAEAENWYNKFRKPILMTEYGADTIPGLHMLPEYVWSEEYQNEVMSEHFKAFDILRSRGYFIGEMIWNFADFMTAQTTTRVGGNRKGIFTRQRQPKASAHLLRKRYFGLAKELDGAKIPNKLFEYTSQPVKKARTDL